MNAAVQTRGRYCRASRRECHGGCLRWVYDGLGSRRVLGAGEWREEVGWLADNRRSASSFGCSARANVAGGSCHERGRLRYRSVVLHCTATAGPNHSRPIQLTRPILPRGFSHIFSQQLLGRIGSKRHHWEEAEKDTHVAASRPLGENDRKKSGTANASR
ncbi:uncharacterized protein L203_104329 [Cryptococcus depauperatus CBS 7841]|uniref:Uncharacterized protein n=1 Tax=Cryptococcus depauperatus CBS 7841 TaxID=1295531 RepID=A0AAJ8M2F8_9TREE